MGKGDRRSTKGKTWRNSYGKSRPKKKNVKKPYQPKQKLGLNFVFIFPPDNAGTALLCCPALLYPVTK